MPKGTLVRTKDGDLDLLWVLLVVAILFPPWSWNTFSSGRG